MNNASFNTNLIIKLKDQSWANNQRIAGKVIAKVLNTLKSLIEDKTTKSLLELDQIAEEIIIKNKCLPTFKGYKGFPNACCISVNKQLVHAIPSNYYLQEGDLISFDLGATYNGAIADAALTVIYGQPKATQHSEMIDICQESLYQAIKTIRIGKQLGSIGFAISKYVSNNSNFSLITNYGGHGIDTDVPHAPPFVSNKSQAKEGIRIQPGLTLAIEPMLTLKPSQTKVLSDGWTVETDELSSHAEHSVFIHQDHLEIMTWREEEQTKIPNKIYFN